MMSTRNESRTQVATYIRAAALALVAGGMATLVANADASPATTAPQPSAATPDPLEASVRRVVEPLVERYGRAAVMVAVVEPSGDRIFSFGSVDPAASQTSPPNASSLFEIGSVTKLFTALLLAQMTLRGEVELDDPVRDYVPSTLRLPEWDGRAISIRDLVTHRSGLPYLPSDMPVMRRHRGEVVAETESIGHPSGARYPVTRLAAILPTEKLQAAPGTRYAYSPLGLGLLGLALAERAQKPLAELMRERVLRPLELQDSEFMAEARANGPRYTQGHDEHGRPTFFRNDQEALAACCGLRSSARDLARFVRLQLDPSLLQDVTLRRAVLFTQLPQRLGGNTHAEHIGLGWHILQRPHNQLYKLGRMSGHRAFIELNLEQRRGVVVLAAHGAFPVEDVAHALLPRETVATEITTRVVEDRAGPTVQAARWNDGLTLLEATARPARVRAGDSVELRLRLQATQPQKRSYQLFLHADSRAGRLLSDHAPRVPTERWRPGQVIEHRIRFSIRRDYPSGPLQLWFGWFDAAGRAAVEAGPNDGENRVQGPLLTVLPSVARTSDSTAKAQRSSAATR